MFQSSPNVEFLGLWWLPDDPQKRFSGNLKITEGNSILLSLSDVNGLPDIDYVDIINGITNNGTKITLNGCYHASSSGSFHGFSTIDLDAENAFVGIHFTNPEDINFYEINISTTYVNEWLNESGFAINKVKGKVDSIKIDYSLPKDIVLFRDSSLAFSICFTYDIPTRIVGDTVLKEHKVFNLNSKNGLKLKESFKFVRIIKQFLSFATLKPTYSYLIEGNTEAGSEEFVRIYSLNFKERTLEKNYSKHDFLFTFDEMKKRKSKILKNWLFPSKQMEMVRNLFFTSICSENIILENSFLNYIQALEILYKSVTHKDNKSSLKTLFNFFTKSYSNVITKVVKNKDDLIERTIATRNLLVHGTFSQFDYKGDLQELVKIVDTWKVIVYLSLLKETGFPENFLKSVLKNPFKARRLAFIANNQYL